jgi:NAD(P)-dependent dehydrogenase (short-subunit alcohol dehydrogenase family)
MQRETQGYQNQDDGRRTGVFGLTGMIASAARIVECGINGSFFRFTCRHCSSPSTLQIFPSVSRFTMSGPPPSSGYAFVGMDNLHHDIYPAISAAQTPSLKQPGKVVLITGASRGIGRAVALQYAHAGVSSIIIVARSSSKLDEVATEIAQIDEKIRVHKFSVDVIDSEAVRKCAEQVAQKEGRLDILVNNAGNSSAWEKITETKPEDWWGCLELNLKGPYLFLRAFLPLMMQTAEKEKVVTHVINMSSIGAHMVNPSASAYMISKMALCRLTEFVQAEYGDKGINVVALHPGGVATELTAQEKALEACKFSPRLFFTSMISLLRKER